jgi:chitosanase
MSPLETKTPFLETTSPPLSGTYMTLFITSLLLTSDSNGKMFYGILGDTNGNDPQVTGEASWLMARTCFPDDDLRGNSGHAEADVTCTHPSIPFPTNLPAGQPTRTDILFTGQNAVLPPSAVNEHYITDFGTLKFMGDRLVNALLVNLRLPGTTPSEDSGSQPQPPPPAQTQSQSPSQPQAPAPPPPPPSITGPSEQPPSHTLTPSPSPSSPTSEAEPAGPSPSTPEDNDDDGEDDDCEGSSDSSSSSHLDPNTNSIFLRSALAFLLVLILTRGL